MKLPGFLSPLGMLLATLALFLVAGIVLVQGNLIFKPGELSTANDNGLVLGEVNSHAAIGNNCAACHTSPWSAVRMADQCIACHTEIEAQLDDPSKLHGLPEYRNCRDCHVEHRGPNGILTQVVNLIVDHDRFPFSLARHQTTGDGQPFPCADCHTESLARFDAATCENCHRERDPNYTERHIAEYGQACRECHDGVDHFSKDRFDHNDSAFPLLGRHVQVTCVSCHAGVTTLIEYQDAPTDCIDCHRNDNPHPPAFGQDCAVCHNSDGWPTEIFDHDLAAYKLTGKHNDVACADCHINRIYRGTPTTCVGCHAKDDKHLGQVGSDCAACHTTDTWKREPFVHTFPLDHGGQGLIACATCHTDPQTYKTYTCYNCHNPVDIKRIHAFADMMGTDITDCVRCHPTGQSTMRMH